MTQKQIIALIEVTLEEKIQQNEKFIRYSFYELNVKYPLKSETERKTFLKMLINKLENNNYKVFLEGQKFEYNNTRITVQCNEVLIAIKNEKEDKKNGRKI